jgi:hypothetical protein
LGLPKTKQVYLPEQTNGIPKLAKIWYFRDMIIQQTVDIPADRSTLELNLTLPEKHPSGTVTVEVSLKPEKNGFFNNLFASKFYKNFDEFYGCLKGAEAFEGDSVDIVHRMRDEWDRPWDKNAEA